MHSSRIKDVARLGLAQVHVKHRHAVGHLVQVLGAVGAEERAGDGVEAQEDLVRLRRRRQLLGLGEQRARRAAVDGEDLAVGGGIPLLRVGPDTLYRSMSLIFLATPFRWRPLSF